MDAIVVEGLHKRYKDVQALAGVSFSVQAGEVFGLLGPNGAGKSTTVRILATLTQPGRGPRRRRRPRRPPRGGRGPPRDRLRPAGLRRRPYGTGRENLTLQGHIQGMGGAELRAARRRAARARRDRRRRRPRSSRPTRAACSAGSTSRSGSSTARRCSSSTSRRPASTPRRASQMWEEVGRLAAQESADDPAHDALPRGGRRARRPARDRQPRARSSSRARRPR